MPTQYTFLQTVIVPGSCPAELATVSKAVPTFKPLTVVSKDLAAKNETVSYSVPGTVSASANSVVYLSGQNLPVTVPISDVSSRDDMSYFSASLPFQSPSQFAKGLTIAVVVEGCGKQFTNSSEVASATVYGPGIIEID